MATFAETEELMNSLGFVWDATLQKFVVANPDEPLVIDQGDGSFMIANDPDGTAVLEPGGTSGNILTIDESGQGVLSPVTTTDLTTSFTAPTIYDESGVNAQPAPTSYSIEPAPSGDPGEVILSYSDPVTGDSSQVDLPSGFETGSEGTISSAQGVELLLAMTDLAIKANAERRAQELLELTQLQNEQQFGLQQDQFGLQQEQFAFEQQVNAEQLALQKALADLQAAGLEQEAEQFAQTFGLQTRAQEFSEFATTRQLDLQAAAQELARLAQEQGFDLDERRLALAEDQFNRTFGLQDRAQTLAELAQSNQYDLGVRALALQELANEQAFGLATRQEDRADRQQTLAVQDRLAELAANPYTAIQALNFAFGAEQAGFQPDFLRMLVQGQVPAMFGGEQLQGQGTPAVNFQAGGQDNVAPRLLSGQQFANLSARLPEALAVLSSANTAAGNPFFDAEQRNSLIPTGVFPSARI